MQPRLALTGAATAAFTGQEAPLAGLSQLAFDKPQVRHELRNCTVSTDI